MSCLQRYMHEMIREQSTAPGRVDGLAVKRRETRDLFSNLVTALGEEVDGVNWTTEDVFGSTFTPDYRMRFNGLTRHSRHILGSHRRPQRTILQLV